MNKYNNELKEYISLENTIDKHTPSACYDVAHVFDKILETYNKSAGEMFFDIDSLKSERVPNLHNGKPISAYDLGNAARIRKRTARSGITRPEVPGPSPYEPRARQSR